MPGFRIDVRGTVQGVGFRPWVARLARELDVRGEVRNSSRGVRIEAYGANGSLELFLQRLQIPIHFLRSGSGRNWLDYRAWL